MDAARKTPCISALCIVLACGLPAQTPPPTCTVEGYLTEAITGTPIADATITAGIGVRSNSAKTDANGHFVFHELPPGNYTFLPNKDGYEPGSIRRQTLTVSTAPQQVDLQLSNGAVLSGRVLDEDRNPVAQATVSLRMKGSTYGLPTFVPIPATTTDDAGEYRFEHLHPGQYFVFAKPISTPKKSPKPEAEAVMTFYPDASSIETAVPITLRPRERHDGVDIRLRKSPAYCARGSLLVDAGSPSSALTIAEPIASSYIDDIAPVNIDKAGAFEVCGLAPGTWSVRTPASVVIRAFGKAFGSTFDISDHDVDLGALAAQPSYTIQGTLSVDGARTDDPPPIGTMVQTHLFVGSMVGLTLSPLRPNGSFTFSTRTLDPIWLSVKPLPGYYLRRVMIGGKDMTYQPIPPTSTDVQIVLGSDAAIVTGKAIDKDNQPVSEAAVILAPAQLPQQGAPGLIQVVQTDRSGSFTLQSIAPGDYLLLTFSISPKGDGEDPDFIRAHSADATRLSLQPHDRQSVTITVR